MKGGRASLELDTVFAMGTEMAEDFPSEAQIVVKLGQP